MRVVQDQSSSECGGFALTKISEDEIEANVQIMREISSFRNFGLRSEFESSPNGRLLCFA
jgi:hypothetical protein